MTSTARAQDHQRDELTDVPREDEASSAIENAIHSASQGLAAALIQTATSDTTATPPLILESVGAPEDSRTAAEDDGEATTLSPLATVASPAAVAYPDATHSATLEPALSEAAFTAMNQEIGQPSGTQGISEDASLPISEFPDHEAQSVLDGTGQGTTDHRGEVGRVLSRQEQQASMTPSGPFLDQALPVQQEQPRQDGLTHRLTMDADRLSQSFPSMRPNQSHTETKTDSLREKQDNDSMPIFASPHSRQSFSDAAQQSDMSWSAWSDWSDLPHERDDTSMSQPAATSTLQITNGQVTETISVGTAPHSMPRPLETPRAPSVIQGQSGVSPLDTSESPMPAMTRSIVLEVAQPDLGRVNVRVAMTNDLVHTHMSSDRSEVGQFLINGQDRLQAALQANGLDMGQFRVDIDRHSAGRSFQQGHSQDQERPWYQNPGHGQSDHATEFHDGRQAGSYSVSMLNLVA